MTGKRPGLATPTRGRAHFVGRRPELSLLDREIARAVSGEGRILFLRGEAGIGKTRLVEEALARYATPGQPLEVRRARCSNSVGVPAYWPWRRLLGASVGLLEGPDGNDSADAQLADPFERLHAAAGEILQACGSHGVILVIDDVQWADVGSIQLLDVLAQSIDTAPMAVIATLRDPLTSSVVAQGIEGLFRHRSVNEVWLGGWSAGEVREYLEATGRETTEQRPAEAWHRVTGGNPYFVEELARTPFSLAESPEPPTRVQRLITQRVEACEPATRLLLQLAAVIGRDFPLALAQRIADRAFGEADVGTSAIHQATRAHLLEPAETPEHFRFVHGLVADALLRTTPVRLLAALHGHLGEILAEQPALRVGGIAEVARHLATASTTLPAFAPRTAAFSKWAGYEASLQQQHDLAVEHYRAALDALASVGESSEAPALERAELLVSLGHSLSLASPQDAEAALDEAEALAESRLHGAERDRAARVLGLAVVVRAQERCPATAEGCRRETARADAALAALDGSNPGDERLRAQLLAAYAPLLAFEPDRERPAALAREALRVAEATDDPLALGAALEAVHWSLIDDPSVEERLAVASQVLAQAIRAGSERLAATARCWRYFDLLEGGHIDDAVAELAAIDELAQRLGEPRRRHQALALRAGLAIHRGRLDQAESLADEALTLGRRAAIPESAVIHEGAMTRIAFERDDPSRISNRESLRSALRSQSLFQASNPLIQRWQGREQSAATDLGLLKTRGFDAIPHGPDRLGTLYTLAWTAVFLEDRDAARDLYDRLLPHAERMVVFHLASYTGSVPRVLANLALLLGRLGDAEHHFHVAFRSLERSDARLEWAHLYRERAALRIAQGARPGAEPVLDDLRRALALAREVGSHRVVNQIRASHPELVESGGTRGAAQRTGWFQQRDRSWRVGIGAASYELPDGRGLQFIAALLAHPGEEILATTLVADVTGDLDVPLERARLRVTQRVRATLSRLRALDPALAAHLGNALRTGNYCAYLPRADDRVTWRL